MRSLLARFQSIRWRWVLLLCIYVGVRWTPLGEFLDLSERDQVRDACIGAIVLAGIGWSNRIGKAVQPSREKERN